MFRRGDLVVVRPAADILATLDSQGALDGLPFMPEMLDYLGRPFTVARRAEKTCNTIDDWGSLRLLDTVILDDLRCSGEGHGGCQADCLIYWKEAWVSPANAAPSQVQNDDESLVRLQELTRHNSQRTSDPPGQRCYRCQTTEMLTAAPTRLGTAEPLQYLREYTSGNVGLVRWVRVVVRAVLTEARRKLRPESIQRTRGNGAHSSRPVPLNLQAGEWVMVKSEREIGATLTADNKNRGLWFDREMVPFCGSLQQVRGRVNRLIDERTGAMIELTSDCIKLEGVVCSGELSCRRWFCPRKIFPYWREAWLHRADIPVSSKE